MDKIISEIRNIRSFDLKMYFTLIDKYGEKNVITAFKTLLVNSKNSESKIRILQKYSSAFITIDVENLVIDKNSYKKLCNKYGEDNVNKYIIECEEVGRNTKIYDSISQIMDFLAKDEEVIDDFDDDFDNVGITNNFTIDSMRQYLKEISKIPILSHDEEKEIFRKYI